MYNYDVCNNKKQNSINYYKYKLDNREDNMDKKANLRIIAVAIIMLFGMNIFSYSGEAATVKYVVTGMSIMYVGDTSNVSFYKDSDDETAGIIETGVKWKVSNSNIATIDNDGIIIAKEKGTVTVTGTYKGHKATRKITIKSKQLNHKDLHIPLNRTEYLTVLGGSNGIKNIKVSNKECLSIEADPGTTHVEIVAKKKGTTKVTLVTEEDNKEYTVNVTVIDPLELTITKVTRRTVKGEAVLDFTLRNDSKHTISTYKKIGALGDDYGSSVLPMKSDAVIQPGKSKTLTILSELSVKTYGKDVLKGMIVSLNVKYEGHVYGIWFDHENKKINSVSMSPFKFNSMYD